MTQAHIDAHRGVKRDNSRNGAPNNVLPGYAQLHPPGRSRWITPCASKGESRVGFACWDSCECSEDLPVTWLSGMWCINFLGQDFVGQGDGLNGPYGYLPTQHTLWFCNSVLCVLCVLVLVSVFLLVKPG